MRESEKRGVESGVVRCNTVLYCLVRASRNCKLSGRGGMAQIVAAAKGTIIKYACPSWPKRRWRRRQGHPPPSAGVSLAPSRKRVLSIPLPTPPLSSPFLAKQKKGALAKKRARTADSLPGQAGDATPWPGCGCRLDQLGTLGTRELLTAMKKLQGKSHMCTFRTYTFSSFERFRLSTTSNTGLHALLPEAFVCFLYMNNRVKENNAGRTVMFCYVYLCTVKVGKGGGAFFSRPSTSQQFDVYNLLPNPGPVSAFAWRREV